MARRVAIGVVAGLALALGGCGGGEEPPPRNLVGVLVPEGVPTEPGERPADREQLAVVEAWLRALTQGDVEAAADRFADGAVVQNGEPSVRLPDRAARIAFNSGFPCGAEVAASSSVDGYLVVTYRLTDQVDSRCDGVGVKAAGAIRVEDGRMTEWYRLPNLPTEPGEASGPVV